jgi:hypothetical protein
MISRRTLLGSGLAALAMAALPHRASASGGPMAREFFTASENGRRLLRRVTEPLVDLRELRDVDLIVADDFRRTWTASPCNAHPRGIRVRNARIIFENDSWNPRWNQALEAQPLVGISSDACGIELREAPADIDGLHVDGSPKVGLSGWDTDGMVIVRRYSATRCHYGTHLSRRTRGMRVFADGFRFWDGWGPSTTGGLPQDGWVSEGWQSLQNFEISGNIACGVKLCGPGISYLENCQTAGIMFQGRATEAAAPGREETDRLHLYVKDLFLNAGYANRRVWYNMVQCSWGVTAEMDSGYIVGAGHDEVGIQATGDCSLDVHGFKFGGIRYALDLDVRPYPHLSAINADFETANEFLNNTVAVRRAG